MENKIETEVKVTNINFDPNKNAAQNFEIIIKRIEEIANSEERNEPVSHVIHKLIKDINNSEDPEYEQQITEIPFIRMRPETTKKLLDYLKKKADFYSKKEKAEKRKAEKDLKREIKKEEVNEK